jgi:hypothetical protein
MDCQICAEGYDLNNRIPKRLQCGDVFCLECLKGISGPYGGGIKCPNDNRVDSRTFDSIEDDKDTIARLERTLLMCYDHNFPTQNFNLRIFKPVCSLCKINKDINSIDLPSNILKQLVSIYLKEKKKLSKEIRTILKLCLNSSMKTQLTLISLIQKYNTEESKCSVHPMNQATKLSPNTFELHCEEDEVLDPIQIDFNNAVSYIQFYSNDLTDKKLIYSSIPKFLSNRDSKILKSFIEITQMYEKRICSLDQIACQYCEKLFCLGLRMPMQYSCGHVGCFKCGLSRNACLICNQILYFQDPLPIAKLYEKVKCQLCFSEITLENLPFHYICDCIICAACSILSENCNKCFQVVTLIDIYPKIHKRTFYSLIYLDLKKKCDICGQKDLIYLDYSNYRLLCENCNYNPNSIVINNLYEIECNLIKYKYIEDLLSSFSRDFIYYFIGLPLYFKLKILSDRYSNNIRNPNAPYGVLKEFRRFKTVYPVNRSDPRFFKATENVTLIIYSSEIIRLVAVVLAGQRSLAKLPIKLFFRTNETEIECIEKNILSKESYVFLPDKTISGWFSLTVIYPPGSELFSGKYDPNPRKTDEGVNFVFADGDNRNYNGCGPILGFLYLTMK